MTLTSDATRNGITLRKSRNRPVSSPACHIHLLRRAFDGSPSRRFEIRQTFNPEVRAVLETLGIEPRASTSRRVVRMTRKFSSSCWYARYQLRYGITLTEINLLLCKLFNYLSLGISNAPVILRIGMRIIMRPTYIDTVLSRVHATFFMTNYRTIILRTSQKAQIGPHVEKNKLTTCGPNCTFGFLRATLSYARCVQDYEHEWRSARERKKD